MGRIDISFENVRQKNDELSQKIRDELDNGILERYVGLENSISLSCGAGIEAIVEMIGKEKAALTSIKNFMVDLLEFIQQSADAFEAVDSKCKENMEMR